MSHFSTIKTKLTNLKFLKESLNDLNIKNLLYSESSKDLIIQQENDSDITFSWNGQNYDLIADKAFWQLPISHETFLEKVQVKYNYHNLMSQATYLGFVANDIKETVDGTKTIVFQRF
jgi:regulation of enolase protein 1 (concanavalin A-like superfamily)